MNDFPIGVFDSGVGGLSVLRECQRLLPGENFIYLFDRSHAPYGNKSDDEIRACALACAKKLEKMHCKAIVVACNTASATAMSVLRKRIKAPVVGVYPPVRQAVLASGGKSALVLCTAATARQKNFMFACSKYDKNALIVAPQRLLATEIENNFENLGAVKTYLYSILDKYDNVGSVALGCTHYYFVKDMTERYFGGKAKVFPPEKGAAERLFRALKANDAFSGARDGETRMIFS